MRRRWKWMVGVLAASVIVAAIVSFTTTPIYESTVQLTFVRQPDVAAALSGMTSVTSITEAQLQAQTYAQLMTTGDMKKRAEAELGAAIPDDVEVTSEYVPDTAVLRIAVRSDDPEEAAAVANAYAEGFTKWRRQVAVDQYKQALRIIDERIARYGDDPDRFNDPAYVQLVQRRQDIQLLVDTATGNFVVAASAEVPTDPVVPRHTRDLMLGLLIGLVLGIGAVVLLEQLDIRVHTVDEVGEALGLPILARVPRTAGSGGSHGAGGSHAGSASRSGSRPGGGTGPVTLTDPLGPEAEAYRIFRGNLDFADIDGGVRTLMMTSAVQGEGKSTTAANLAVAAALSGKRVILVDADLRRANLHRIFGFKNDVGLSTVLTGRSTLSEALRDVKLPEAGEQEPGVERRLAVLTSGPLPPNPGEIAASQRLADLIASLEQLADLVIIDAPPFLVVGDAGAMSRAVDGVVVVARLGSLTRTVAHESRQFLATLPCRVLGVAVVGIPTESAAYRYKYYSKQPAQTGDESDQAEKGDDAVPAAPPAA